MPFCTAVIDELRAVFGAAEIDAFIAAGMRGEPDQFYAEEGGIVIGTRFTGTNVEAIVQWRPSEK
jgi:hypothetical protein